jgi:hypothetical protein
MGQQWETGLVQAGQWVVTENKNFKWATKNDFLFQNSLLPLNILYKQKTKYILI